MRCTCLSSSCSLEFDGEHLVESGAPGELRGQVVRRAEAHAQAQGLGFVGCGMGGGVVRDLGLGRRERCLVAGACAKERLGHCQVPKLQLLSAPWRTAVPSVEDDGPAEVELVSHLGKGVALLPGPVLALQQLGVLRVRVVQPAELHVEARVRVVQVLHAHLVPAVERLGVGAAGRVLILGPFPLLRWCLPVFKARGCRGHGRQHGGDAGIPRACVAIASPGAPEAKEGIHLAAHTGGRLGGGRAPPLLRLG
mmetsp:Transcript_31601/g.71038  ORF Transcript_31601/g.71038 Transcript_31601/m.71038 type:complete len:252 (+) Transcript_31601:1037-1792(+)